MSNFEQKINITKLVKKQLNKYDGKYTIDEFNNIIDKIHVKIDKNLKLKKIQKSVCKYVVLSNKKINFDTDTKSDFTYESLCKKIKSQSNVMFNLSENDFKIESEKEKESKNDENNKNMYVYPVIKTSSIKKTETKYGPYGLQWVNDKNQKDDPIDSKTKKLSKILSNLMNIDYPEQKSDEWFAMRETCISASDGGCVVDVNPYEGSHSILIKKVIKPPFQSNISCHNGTKFEEIATMIYENRINAKVIEFGLCKHPGYDFLGASPDGIVGKYKMDGKSLTKDVGKMLEIKCPLFRKIKQTGEIKGEICPIYYWVQVQLQLECCNLEECDFWQCDLRHYEDRDAFIKDTKADEPFRSKTSGMEKGCVIQLLPKNKMKGVLDGDYQQILYDSAKYIYPPKIEMSPNEYDAWIGEKLARIDEEYEEYYFDKVVYWKLDNCNCTTINRDRQWFADNVEKFRTMWKKVLFFRENKDKSDIFFEYIKTLEEKIDTTKRRNYAREKENRKKNNVIIMDIADMICDPPSKKDKSKYSEYKKTLTKMREVIYKKNEKEKKMKEMMEEDEEDYQSLADDEKLKILWEKVLHFRENKDEVDVFFNYIDTLVEKNTNENSDDS
jgi:putative phage-type endonuclease